MFTNGPPTMAVPTFASWPNCKPYLARRPRSTAGSEGDVEAAVQAAARLEAARRGTPIPQQRRRLIDISEGVPVRCGLANGSVGQVNKQ